MLRIPLAHLDTLAEQILLASRRLTDGNGLKVCGGSYTREDVVRVALISLHILCGEPVHRSGEIDISEMIARMPPHEREAFKGTKV